MTIESNNNPGGHHNRFKKMTRAEFEKWLDLVDSNKDGNITQKELRAALKVLGLRWRVWKAWRAVTMVDLNRNNVVDGNIETKLLVDYAAKHWGIIVSDR